MTPSTNNKILKNVFEENPSYENQVYRTQNTSSIQLEK